MSLPFPSSRVQAAAIDVSFNSLLVEIMLLGVYTVIYTGTVYIYVAKKSSKNYLVLGAISLSYAAYIATMGVEWFQGRQAFVKNSGISQEMLFFELYFTGDKIIFATQVSGWALAALADGLMIWRCYHVWDRSIRAICVPAFLLFSEIAVNITAIGITAATKLDPSFSQAQKLNEIVGASLFITFLTTMICTLLIAYRIHSVSKGDVLQGSKTRFNHVLEILVQSAAAYSVATLGFAIQGVIPAPDFSLTLNTISGYYGPFYYFTAGAAPTVMVARVALATDNPGNTSAPPHISGLRFHSTSPTATRSGGYSIHPSTGAVQSINEEKDDFDVRDSRDATKDV